MLLGRDTRWGVMACVASSSPQQRNVEGTRGRVMCVRNFPVKSLSIHVTPGVSDEYNRKKFLLFLTVSYCLCGTGNQFFHRALSYTLCSSLNRKKKLLKHVRRSKTTDLNVKDNSFLNDHSVTNSRLSLNATLSFRYWQGRLKLIVHLLWMLTKQVNFWSHTCCKCWQGKKTSDPASTIATDKVEWHHTGKMLTK